jgi:hypothetical protein
MWAVPVVVACVQAQDAFETASEDEDAIEAVAADGAHPALGVGVCVRRSHGCLDHLDPLGAEDLVEGTTELGVALVDQQPESGLVLASLDNEVAGLLGYPGAVRLGRAGDEFESAGREREEEEHVDPLQRQRLDGEEVTGEHAGGLLAAGTRANDWRARSGAGGTPAPLSTLRIVVGEAACPSCLSSPPIRW